MEAKLFMKKLDQTELKHLVMERYKKLKLTSPLYISNNFVLYYSLALSNCINYLYFLKERISF